MTDEPLELTDELVDYYRDVLVKHGSFLGTASNCQICGVARRPDWVDAYDKLAAAHKTMTDEPVWESYQSRRRP